MPQILTRSPTRRAAYLRLVLPAAVLHWTFCIGGGAILFSAFSGKIAVGATLIRADRPNAISFPARQARFVRFVIHESSASQPCIDELEVYGPDGRQNLAAARGNTAAGGATATASSCLPGYAIHQIAHLNDGRYGNSFSWIAAGIHGEWAQIELPEPVKVSKVVFSRDRLRQYSDRVPVAFEIRLSIDGKEWKTVAKIRATAAAVAVRVPPGSLPPPPPLPGLLPIPGENEITAALHRPDDLLRYAFLAEEHAWLKTYGRADLSSRLVPYNGRVKEYPRHVGDDRLPLPRLVEAPKLDGRPDDPCWQRASRGVVRVADLRGTGPYDFEQGPLVEYAVTAGHHDGNLYLLVQTNRLLSSHVAVLSGGDGRTYGVVTLAGRIAGDGRLVLSAYDGSRRVQSTPLDGKFDPSLKCFEFRVPLGDLPECRQQGLRVGLGMGGKHTKAYGRPVDFVFSDLSISELAASAEGAFQVRLTVPPDGDAVSVRGNAPGLTEALTLAPGQSKVVSIPAEEGPIGPEFDLTVDHGNQSYALHLFRYDPLGRTLTQIQQMVERFSAKGLDVLPRKWGRDRQHLAALQQRRVGRQALFDARMVRRNLFFRDPDLASLGKILFVKRHAFQPSHNYSVNLDAPYRGGGGVYLLEVPQRDGRLQPSEARLTELFASGGGIARNPMANFELSKIYFGYRPAADGYYHIMSMGPGGGELTQLTAGPFHDYWPCPLPDGGLAMISTRCKARYLCWRPQAAVMFRMDAEGANIRPLSYANLSEWAPSVMGDGRIIWTRSEYIDKGADFGHTLWAIRANGTKPQLVFGNTIIQPNGYANGREVPGTHEICCTLISHFGDLNGPIALIDIDKGRFNREAIRSITPEVPWPGMWPIEECFRDPFPVARDYFLCSHAPRDRFGLYVIDRFGNREILYLDPAMGSMCPTPFRTMERPPVLHDRQDFNVEAEHVEAEEAEEMGRFAVADVYRGIEPQVKRGTVKYLRVAQELRAELLRMPGGEYQQDHVSFQDWYATPVHKVSGPHGWPSYVAKATWGIAPVEEDGSAHFRVPAGKVLYLQALDEDFNEVQRMRSVVQLQPGERRSCVGCHEDRTAAPPVHQATALRREPSELQPPPWGAGPFSYERVVQPVWDAACVRCHDADDKQRMDLSGTLDADRIPASYRTLISQGWVHYLDCGYNSGGCEKRDPLTFGTVKSRLFAVLKKGHYDVKLTREQMRRVKCWIDLNCPLWPDYIFRSNRPGPEMAGKK